MSEQPEKPQQPPAATREEEGEKKEKPKKMSKQDAKEARMKARLAEQEALAKAKAEAALKFAHIFGKLPMVQSTTHETLQITPIAALPTLEYGASITSRARIQSSRKQGSKMCFVTLRECGTTVQAILAVNDGLPSEMIGFSASIPNESIVQCEAVVSKPGAPVTSTTLHNYELQVTKLHIVSESAAVLPFQYADAARPHQEHKEESAAPTDGEGKKKEQKTEVTVHQDTRLNCRWLELRTPASNAIFRLQSRVCQYFRDYLIMNDFCEIHTPKLIGTASEGGANVFKCSYFGKDAYLAQSPQLYKQMVVQGDMPRVFEVGSVFRAENSFTHRHLTEFIGLDIEMVINEHYYEVLDVAEGLFAYIFERLETLPELKPIQEQHPFEPFVYQVSDEIVEKLGLGVISENLETKDEFHASVHNRKTKVIRIPLPMAIRLLNTKSGKQIPEDEDLDTESEKSLGVIMKERYGIDFYICDRFPASIRPFYTMPCTDDPKFTNSYDIFMRGEEISSGAQRVHDPDLLVEGINKKGVDPKLVKDYIDCFRLGAWPHGGFGVGLERVVMLYLGLKNIRHTSMFPRDPQRLHP